MMETVQLERWLLVMPATHAEVFSHIKRSNPDAPGFPKRQAPCQRCAPTYAWACLPSSPIPLPCRLLRCKYLSLWTSLVHASQPLEDPRTHATHETNAPCAHNQQVQCPLCTPNPLWQCPSCTQPTMAMPLVRTTSRSNAPCAHLTHYGNAPRARNPPCGRPGPSSGGAGTGGWP